MKQLQKFSIAWYTTFIIYDIIMLYRNIMEDKIIEATIAIILIIVMIYLLLTAIYYETD